MTGGACAPGALPEVLVVYAYHRHPMRRVIRDHLYCFARSAACRAHYINLRYRRIPGWLPRQPFDLAVFDLTFTGQRWSPARFRQAMAKAAPLKDLDAPKAIIVQDEFLQTDLLNEFIEDFGIDHVFTNLPEDQVDLVYPRVDRSRTGFTQVLTGYLEPRTLADIRRLAPSVPRTLDIGYRASGFPWLGRHALQKIEIGERAEAAARARGMAVDIDAGQKKESDRLRGLDWHRFLLSCRFTLGVEGGASLLDRDGDIRRRTDAYLAKRPDASFDEVEQACFPGQDGGLRLFALSPRNLEACATRTCQILLEGDYNGVLEPGRHYIELKRDYSNLDQVLDLVQNDEGLRLRLTEQAYQDIVASDRYSYERFVELVLDRGMGGRPARGVPATPGRRAMRRWMAARDWLSWGLVWFVDRFFTPAN